MNWLKRLISNQYFFWALIVFFLLQGIWYAASVKLGIPADETYHYKFIEFYAHAPLSNGPIISDQGPHHFYLGDIERIPNYLYHYLLSFPLRLLENFSASEQTSVLVLRLINLLFGVGSLLMVKKVIRLVGSTDFTAHLVTLLAVITGMFVWIGSAINYDNLSLLLFLIFIFCLLKLIANFEVKTLSWVGVLAVASVLTKITIAPSILAGLGFATYYLLRNKEATRQALASSWLAQRQRLGQVTVVIVGVVLALFIGLFSERIVKNIAVYGTVTPACDQLHAASECLQNGIYARDVNQKLLAQSDKPEANIAEFATAWPELMYERLFFYFGHKSIPANPTAELAKLGLISLLLFSLLIKRQKIISNHQEGFLMAITVFYIVVLILFNLSSFIKNGAILGGYQGRYLLPVLFIGYYFLVKLVNSARWSLSANQSKVFSAIAVIIVAWFCLRHFPPYIFATGTDTDWYYPNTTSFNLQMKSLAEAASQILP
jgi:hypothetical protein